ncbi:RNA-binding domain-containing protein [Jimgerdemannia flammicorona]|uniref:RNA-binding domain-containing protein n=2 Tax=Jimgerdemannia flammicorona TaxID=994334 RepID=A0A433DA50_9FUNG|nr:RNA-binding domain-containing protein [Jimgerdemannia flammicorona]RUS30072.1 RNA-binding domain-containing protein [Jimgerdemannia flammicorona]
MAQPTQNAPQQQPFIPPPIFFPGAPVPLPGPPPIAMPLVPQVPPIPVPKQPPCMTPNCTLYINNLNEKVKIPALKKTLENVFKQYGEIIDISAHGNFHRRGQAFVIFKDEESATRALKEVQHFVLYSKPMVIQYARTKSDAIAQLEGTIEEHKRKRLDEKEKRQREGPKKMAIDQPQASAGFPSTQTTPLFFPGYPGPGGPSAHIPDEYLPPNKILFLQNLPDATTDAMLAALFQQYPGFREVRMVPGKTGIAFVEYDSEPQASVAKDNLNAFQISLTHQIKVTFAKK